MTILVVEDEPKVLELLLMYFKAKGHQTAGSDSGEGGIQLLQQHQPDVILLDVRLKGKLGGVDVLKAARQQHPKVRVIIITGFENAPESEFLQLGAFAVIKKPVRLEELESLIAQP